MVATLRVGFVLLMLLASSHASTPGDGARVEWQAAAAPDLLDSNGKPPVLVAASGGEGRMVVWYWPGRGLVLPRRATEKVAWDVAGPGQMVALLTAAGRTQQNPEAPPPGKALWVPSGYRSLVTLIDRRGRGRVLASLPGDPVAVAWIASRGCAVAAVMHTRGVSVPGGPSDQRLIGAPAILYLVEPGREPRKMGSTEIGLRELSDAGDGRRVFTMEQVRILMTGPDGYANYGAEGVAVRDIITGSLRPLHLGVDTAWLFAHSGFAYVCCWDNLGIPVWPADKPHKGVIKIGVDGSTSAYFPVDRPEAVWAMGAGARGLAVVTHFHPGEKANPIPRLFGVDWSGKRTLLGNFSSGIYFDGAPGSSGIWSACVDADPATAALVAIDKGQPKEEPGVYLVTRNPAGARLLAQASTTGEATGGTIRGAPVGVRAKLSVRGVGQVDAVLLGRIPIGDVRPWMICAVQGHRPYAAENWPPGASLECAVAYPMQVGTKTYVFVDGKVYEPKPASPQGSVATVPAGESSHAREDLVLAFRPVGTLPLPSPIR